MKTKMRIPAGHSKSARLRSAPQKEGAYQLLVVLSGSDPPIWRRIQVPGDISLAALHLVLQAVMGWENCHLYEFKIGRESYGSVAEGDHLFATGMKAAKGIRLKDVLPAGIRTFEYIYDFGDDWIHEIRVEKIATPEDEAPLAVCSAGERACPPEDCGGIHGYYRNLKILEDPGHSDYEDVKDWMGRYDPERFDLERANARLRRLTK
jgi:hypothetical protein